MSEDQPAAEPSPPPAAMVDQVLGLRKAKREELPEGYQQAVAQLDEPQEPPAPAAREPAEPPQAPPNAPPPLTYGGIVDLRRHMAEDGHRRTPRPPIEEIVTLRNARAGETYVAELPGLEAARLEDDDGSELALVDGKLVGTPGAAGDFALRLTGTRDGQAVLLTARLAVIPDPKSLWVARPSNRDDPFWKDDEAFVRADGDLFCVGASKRGRSHARDGSFRDDDFAFAAPPGGWQIGVVADGAGSARFSRRGSLVAVRHVIDSLPPLLDLHVEPRLAEWMQRAEAGEAVDGEIRTALYQSLVATAFAAAAAIETEAGKVGAEAAAFSTTLVLAVARRMGGHWFVGAFSIGDGGAGLLDVQAGRALPLTVADSGEYAGQTRFLQRSEFKDAQAVMDRLSFAIWPRLTAILLMTDGITDPKFPTDTVFADPAAWLRFWAEDLIPAVDLRPDNPDLRQQFLSWMDFWSPGNHDDRTLALMLPREG